METEKKTKAIASKATDAKVCCITEDQLKAIAPQASDDSIKLYIPLLNKWMPYYSIKTKERQAAFVAQILHETACFRYMKEIASGAAYDTGKLAAKLGNTPAKDGDGQKYKGRGAIMITGKDNYQKISDALGVDFVSHPELLEQPSYTIQSACWWWWNAGLNKLADEGDFKTITKKINGGYNGYLDRLMYYKRALLSIEV
jgi:putative chitinase